MCAEGRGFAPCPLGIKPSRLQTRTALHPAVMSSDFTALSFPCLHPGSRHTSIIPFWLLQQTSRHPSKVMIHYTLMIFKSWRTQQDSNPWNLRPKRSTLTRLSYASIGGHKGIRTLGIRIRSSAR